MNQSILFSDQLTWNEETGMVEFHAQQAGMLIICLVSLDKLGKLNNSSEVSKENAFEQFEAARFDIEEIAESLVEDEAFDEQGRIIIN
ncbi:DUF1488 domain-containing protein [Vibrio sp. SCSIO 43140]|uniref:DUF1488 domain-containing protein n=1 Tax=Vibrio TaxID=662 RepID=UPI0020754700|nr:DUF1488 domain-containing protein [Vibrio sp. SCSIO 43140]USD60416.1 DUF1488 domain-containing protein [Vibrio sp. SCSIO 43140]